MGINRPEPKSEGTSFENVDANGHLIPLKIILSRMQPHLRQVFVPATWLQVRKTQIASLVYMSIIFQKVLKDILIRPLCLRIQRQDRFILSI